MCSLFKITNILGFFTIHGNFTLPYLDLAPSFLPLRHSYTPLTPPPPFQNLSEIAVLFPTRLGKLSWKIPTRVSLFSFFSRQLQNGAIILDNAIFLQKKQHYKKEKKEKEKGSDGLGRQTSAACSFPSYLPYLSTVCYHYHESPIKYI